jgi:hypothetical protein
MPQVVVRLVPRHVVREVRERMIQVMRCGAPVRLPGALAVREASLGVHLGETSKHGGGDQVVTEWGETPLEDRTSGRLAVGPISPLG